jgi:hypothetical protein
MSILKYGGDLHIDYMSINDWTCVAVGTEVDIGIELRIGRGSILFRILQMQVQYLMILHARCLYVWKHIYNYEETSYLD